MREGREGIAEMGTSYVRVRENEEGVRARKTGR